MKRFQTDLGFTLIEILIVVIIIGILILMAIPQLARIRVDAWTNTCASNRSTLTNLSEAYHTAILAYPAAAVNAFQVALVSGGYEKAPVSCPATNTDTYSFGVDPFDGTANVTVCVNDNGVLTPAAWVDPGANTHYHR